jgi:hypothetical protein
LLQAANLKYPAFASVTLTGHANSIFYRFACQQGNKRGD